MSDDERLAEQQGRSVVGETPELRARRLHLVAEARAERRRGRRLRELAVATRDRNLDLSWRLWSLTGLPEPPSTIPLSWDVPLAAAERLEAACVAAEECAEACAAALVGTDGEARRTLASISGVASFAADCARIGAPDSRRALSLCVRVIQSNSILLDGLGCTGGGALAASSSRRCAEACTRSLAASYLEAEG